MLADALKKTQTIIDGNKQHIDARDTKKVKQKNTDASVTLDVKKRNADAWGFEYIKKETQSYTDQSKTSVSTQKETDPLSDLLERIESDPKRDETLAAL